MNNNGSMARGSDLATFCSEYGLTMVTVAQLVRYRLETELDQPPALNPSGAYGHGPDWEKLLEEDTMHGNSTSVLPCNLWIVRGTLALLAILAQWY
jgi:hypothetical protein